MPAIAVSSSPPTRSPAASAAAGSIDVRTAARVILAALTTYTVWFASPGVYGELTGPDHHRSKEAVIDLLQKGQGVFAIALDNVWNDLEGTLSKRRRAAAGGS